MGPRRKLKNGLSDFNTLRYGYSRVQTQLAIKLLFKFPRRQTSVFASKVPVITFSPGMC